MLTQLLAWGLNLPVLVYVAVGLASVWYLTIRRSVPKNIPPLPVRPYPILGHLPLLDTDPNKTLHQWRKSTGDIYSIYLGPKLTVVINSWELLKESLVKKADVFSDRPHNIVSSHHVQHGGELGIVLNHGPSWKEHRSVAMAILRDFGMGKNWLAEKITGEIDIYLDTLDKFKGQPTEARMLTNAAVSNVICAILVGQRFELDDPYFTKLLDLLNESFTLLSGTTILHIFPWLQHLPGDFFKAKRLIKNFEDIKRQFCSKFLQKAKDNEGGQGVDNFISSYLKQVKEKEGTGTQTFLTEKSLIDIISDLFAAGSETTSTTILWALLFAIRHPEAQEKVYQDIVEHCGPEKRPTIQDRSKMTYVTAYVMETQRLGSIAPLSVSHKCTETTEVGGYTIPAGTTIIPNLDEVHKDAKTWGDPLVFRPERFIDNDHKLLVPDEFIPFSTGRRYCMGESLARMELFLFITAIFQRFHILPEDANSLPSTQRVFGITCAPKPFKIKFTNRLVEK